MTPLAAEALLLEEQRIHDQHAPGLSSLSSEAASYYSQFSTLPQYTFTSHTDNSNDIDDKDVPVPKIHELRTMLPFTKGIDYLSSMDDCIRILVQENQDENNTNNDGEHQTIPNNVGKDDTAVERISIETNHHHQQHVQDIITKGFVDAVVQPYIAPPIISVSSSSSSGSNEIVIDVQEESEHTEQQNIIRKEVSSTSTDTVITNESEGTLLSLKEITDTPLQDEIVFIPLYAATDIPPKDFLSRLKHPQAADIIELLRSFLKNYKELDITGIYDQLPDPDAYDDIEEDDEEEEMVLVKTNTVDEPMVFPASREAIPEGTVVSSTEANVSVSTNDGSILTDANTSFTSVSNEQTAPNSDWAAVLRPVHSSELFSTSQSTASLDSMNITSTPTVDTNNGNLTHTTSSSTDTVLSPIKVSSASASSSSNTSTATNSAVRNDAPVPSTPTSKPTPRSTNKRNNNPSTPKSPRVNIPSPADRVRAFLTRVEETIRSHPLWRNDTATEWDTTSEELEKFVMCRIFDDVFAAHSMCARRDRQLSSRMQSLSFITFRNLDLPEPSPRLAPGWRLAQAALRDIDRYKAPGDKLSCVMNCCRILSTLLTESVEERGGKDKGVGADEFLPALIYTVIKACPPRLYSSLRYIGEFRAPSKLMSEQGYFYTNVLSAVAFSKRVKPEQLSMTHSEFEAAVRQAKLRAEKKRLADIERGIEATAIARRLGKFTLGDGPVGIVEGDFAAELEVEKKLLALRISDSALSFAGLRKSASAIDYVEGAETFSSGRPSTETSNGEEESEDETKDNNNLASNTRRNREENGEMMKHIKDGTNSPVFMDNEDVTTPSNGPSEGGTTTEVTTFNERIVNNDEFKAVNRLQLSLLHIQHELERIVISDSINNNIPIPTELHHLQQLRSQIDNLIEQL